MSSNTIDQQIFEILDEFYESMLDAQDSAANSAQFQHEKELIYAATIKELRSNLEIEQ